MTTCTAEGCQNSYRDGWRLFRTAEGFRCWEHLSRAEQSQFRKVYRMPDPSRRPLSSREAAREDES